MDTANIPFGSVNPVVAQPLYLALVPASVGLPNCPTEEGCNLLVVATLEGSIFAFNAGDITPSGGTGAANQDPAGTTHGYFGVGNGPFQQNTTYTTLYNWGQSVLDFTATSAGFATSPTEYFTPNGNAAGGGQIPVTPPEGSATPAYTFQGMNQNDFDMAVSGVMLYTDSSSNQWLLTFDKAGYGYLLRQANLCGDTTDETPLCFPGVSTSLGGHPGFATGDPGNAFPFAGNQAQCQNLEGDTACDRITSLAFDPDSSTKRLYLWPSNETLTSIESSNNQAIEPAGATIGSNGTTICGSGTTFTTWLVPGDALIDEGSANSGQSRIVTGITSNTQITVNQAFTNPIGSCTTVGSNPCSCTSLPDSVGYSGWFVNPARDTSASGDVDYPGGSVVVTSNSGSGAVAWGLAIVGTNTTIGGNSLPAAVLAAYDAANVANGPIWCTSNSVVSSCPTTSQSTFFEISENSFNSTGVSFSIPTINNGYVYIPTSGITASAGSSCSPSAPCSGVIVYSGHGH
ncbi:MAG: hypothetical protein ACLP59_07055 [Bryobacteraceae bacterium]